MTYSKVKKYKVKSESDPGVKYEIQHFTEADRYTCSCPAFTYNKLGKHCKHIKKVINYQKKHQ